MLKKEIPAGEFLQINLLNGDVLKGKVSRTIPSFGIVLKTFSPSRFYSMKWNEIKTVKKLPTGWKPTMEKSQDNILKLKEQILKAEKVRIKTRGECMLIGKPERFYSDMLILKHPCFDSIPIDPETITEISVAGKSGSFTKIKGKGEGE